MKLVLFDIDGTLLLTGGAGAVAFNQAFEDLYGIKDVWQNVEPHGRTDISLIKELFIPKFKRQPTAAEIEIIKQKYCAYLPQALLVSTKYHLMPHVPDVLNVLSQNKTLSLGLVTGNFKESAYAKLKRGNIDHYFKFGGFGCDGEDRLDLTVAGFAAGVNFMGVKPEKTFLIGDTVHDVRCGCALDFVVIAVATGPASVNELRLAGADHVLTDLAGLQGLLV